MFKERLENYRHNLHLNKRQMAGNLEINESYYNLIASGKREPSRTVIDKLVVFSGLSEEYWICGINKADYDISNKNEFKNLRNTLDIILEHNVIKSADELFDENNNPTDSLGKLLVKALRKDIDQIIKKTL